VIIFFISGRLPVQPNFLGKITTTFQMATLAAILLQIPLAVFLWTATASVTILSCAVYVLRELKQLNGAAS